MKINSYYELDTNHSIRRDFDVFINVSCRDLLLSLARKDGIKYKNWCEGIADNLAICHICNHLYYNNNGLYWQYHGYLHVKKYIVFT